jgi:arylsulfatase A-like enzyme
MQGDHHMMRKTYAYEGSARIPFLVRYPAGLELPARTCDAVVGLQDVMPTVLDVAGVDPPPGMTGRSVLEALRGDDWREYLHGEHSPCYAVEEAMQYLTDGREKYIWFPATGRVQLFDLSENRGERLDLAQDPTRRDRLDLWRRRLVEILAPRGDGFCDGARLVVRRDRWGPVVGED